MENKKQDCIDCQILGMQKILDFWIRTTFAMKNIRACIDTWNNWLIENNSKLILNLNEKDNCIFFLKNKYYKRVS